MRDDRINREILQRIERKLDWLHHELRHSRREEALGDYLMARTQAEVLELVRSAGTVSAATNAGLREVIKLLHAGQGDPAKNEEAAVLLEAMIADDMRIIKENTPEALPPVEEPPVVEEPPIVEPPVEPPFRSSRNFE